MEQAGRFRTLRIPWLLLPEIGGRISGDGAAEFPSLPARCGK